MSWVNPKDHHRADILACKGLRLIKSANANIYHWVAAEIVGTLSILDTVDVVTKVVITVGNPLDLAILPVGMKERVYNSCEDVRFLFTSVSSLVWGYFHLSLIFRLS